MDHAVGALLIVAGAVLVPLGGLHQLPERLGVALAQQVAGPLPAEHVARGLAPRRASVALVAGEEVEKEGGLVEPPVLALSPAEDVAEQLLRLATVEEVLLVGGALIGVAGRD